MRVGKKATVVEAKKTRSCVVRLEKVLPPIIKATRSSGVSSRAHVQLHSDEKKFKGPLKKRPIAQGSSAAASPKVAPPNATMTLAKAKETKEKLKAPIKGHKKESAKVVVPEQPPPTIAAGRSRRAIKPNPKYASEDMVTPKTIRNVTALAGTSGKRPSILPEKQRKKSTSSSEDFFNRDSSDELGANELDDELDKMYKAIEKETDSDFSDDPKVVATTLKRRGRPRKTSQASPTSTPSVKRSTPLPVHKGQTSQLQLLRKSFAASVNRSIEPLAGIKRARNESVTGGSSSDNDDDAAGVARKRLLLTKSAIVRDNKISNSSEISMMVRKANQTLNGSKIVKIKPDGINIEQPKRNTTIIEKRTLMDGNSVPVRIQQQARPLQTMRNTSSTVTTTNTTRTLITIPSKTQNARVLAVAKRRSASPAFTKITKVVNEEKIEERMENKLADSSLTTVDDFETMPTFTIVNINDIINKKGDVLISKTGKLQKPDESMKSDYDLAEQEKVNEHKPGLGRRKILIADKASDITRSNSPLTASRKPAQKILNHTLLKKSSPSESVGQRSKTNSSISPDKPAPRILNAMVAKKTQPVKPMIANFEDSADDEIYPLSLDGDEEENEEEDASETPDAVEEEEEYPDDSFDVGKHKLSTSTPYYAKKTTPSAKENSQTSLNRQPNKNIVQRKMSPEKVVISRQGDKIIKKITCFETWYVIIPEEVTPKVARNILDIPLIKLANIATEIDLPTEDWKSKVTLHELSPTMIAKSNLITYTGDLNEYNIAEQDRGRYQPSCVMFRRSVNDRTKSRLPYDRAVIFKNKTFFTNIEGKNVKLVGAPSTVNSQTDVELLLQIVDSLTLQSSLVEPTNTMQ